MAKNSDWGSGKEIQDIMERFVERFPGMFEGFDVGRMHFIVTQKKKSRVPIALHSVGHPMEVFVGKPYVVEAFDLWWKGMDAKKKNLAVFHVMCSVPQGGFDETSKHYGKKLQPEIKMFLREFAASGGVPNWMDNPAASDPMEKPAEEVAKAAEEVKGEALPADKPQSKVRRVPVTTAGIASVGAKKGAKPVAAVA